MRVLIVGSEGRAAELSAELATLGIAAEVPERLDTEGAGDHEARQLAADLIHFERLLRGEEAAAVVLVDASNGALAALLVAGKLGVPVARLAGGGQPEEGPAPNRRLVAQLADAELRPAAQDVARWLERP